MCKNIYLCVHCSIFIHLLLLYTGSWEMACSSNAVRKWHSFIPRSSLTQWLLTTVVCRYHIIVYSIHVCLIVSVHFVYNDQIFNSKGDTVLKNEKRNKWYVLNHSESKTNTMSPGTFFFTLFTHCLCSLFLIPISLMSWWCQISMETLLTTLQPV